MERPALYPLVEYDPTVIVEPYPWFIEPFWMKGKINILFGPEKAGKSRLLGWLLASALRGDGPLDGRLHPEQMVKKWLYLAGEEQPEEVMDRLRTYYGQLGGDPKDPLPVTFIAAAGIRLEQPGRREGQRGWLERQILDGGFDGLVMEPLRRLHAGEENKNDAMAPLDNDLRRWTSTHGLTIVAVHHTGKLSEYADMNRIATWSRGCTDLAAILDTGQFLEQIKVNDDDTRKLRLLRAGRFKPVRPLLVHDLTDPRGFALFGGEYG